ncbi:MAG: transcriptional regulator [Gammaproteobacteria bacterium]|jgi:y4mF family transcriptional regulator|nr:transcriptional regulator [Gammaproteobacteria bacterium]
MDATPLIRAVKITSTHAIGAQVKIKRKQRRLTQSGLAKAAGVGTRFISELENGKSTLQWNKTLEVLAYLEISLYIDN